jgi:hypothetical protein
MRIDNINICEEGDEQLYSTEYELLVVKFKKEQAKQNPLTTMTELKYWDDKITYWEYRLKQLKLDKKLREIRQDFGYEV